MKRGRVLVEPGKPLQFIVDEEVDSEPTDTVRRIGDALIAYIRAGAELLKGRYAPLANIAPRHLRERSSILVLRCSDGVFVRYDPLIEEKGKHRFAETSSTLAEIVPGFSEGALRMDMTPQDIQPGDCPQFTFAVTDPTGATRGMLTIPVAMFASSKLSDGFVQSTPPARPTPIISVQSEVDMDMVGHLEEVRPVLGASVEHQHFVAHSRFQLPVGWLAIEIYPPLGDEYWQATSAPMWAELDILATAAQHNLRQSQLNALDSRVDAREAYAALLEEFEKLMQGPEEPVHQFLKAHPELISPASDKFWSKLHFGDRVSDFVFREPYNDYELVEIEAPIRTMFRKDGQQREELTHAINQISDWIRYIEDNRQKVETELGLTGISTNPRSLVVIGRSDTLTTDDRRKLTTIQNQIPKLRILTYDDLLASARATLERILGPLSFRGQNVRIYFFNE